MFYVLFEVAKTCGVYWLESNAPRVGFGRTLCTAVVNTLIGACSALHLLRVSHTCSQLLAPHVFVMSMVYSSTPLLKRGHR